MLRWCWIGDHGSIERRDDMERAAAVAEAAATTIAPFRNVALVVDSTGLVGAALLDILASPSTPQGPWKVYAVSRSPPPPWSAGAGAGAASSSDANHVVHLHLDLADPAAVAEALEPLNDITHLFYAALSPSRGPTEDDEAREANCGMLHNVLTVVVPNCLQLLHICIQTGRKQFVDPFEPLAGIPSAIVEMRPYSEDLPRLEYPDLEDVLLNELAPAIIGDGGASITWSVHRPAATLFGFSPRSASNVVASFCVYAAICQKEGDALRWPGSLVAWEGFRDASDADLVAEQMLWAALETSGMNEAFNCTNGDVYKWKSLWPMLASHFEVEWSGYDGEDKCFKLEEAMTGKEAVWAEIVREKGLVETRLDDITAWWFVDALINADKEQLENMNKCKERGFFGFRNTVRSFNTLIEKMKADRIVP